MTAAAKPNGYLLAETTYFDADRGTLDDVTPGERRFTMAQRSKYQESVIKNYYKNRDAIALQKLSEMVTDLYLSEGKARERAWKSIVSSLEKLGTRPAQIEHLRQKDDPALVAKLVEELLAKS